MSERPPGCSAVGLMGAEDRAGNGATGVFRSWCLRELAYWNATDLDSRVALENLAGANRVLRSVFLLDISDGTVRIRDKPEFFTRDELDNAASSDPKVGRINTYRRLVEHVVTTCKLDLQTVVAVDVNDKPNARLDTPIFGFQKERNSPAILLPDIDFMLNGFYQTPDYDDKVRYEDKSTSAIFVGSTSGAGTITKEAVHNLSVPRIRSAMYFKKSRDVHFRVPAIVQCDSVETEKLIEALGIAGPRTPVAAQFGHKFIISIDGNGATCSRIVVALKSNCVLLKYESPHMLYYFDRLIPWVHYVPIFQDQDVENVILLERKEPGTFASIARESADFYTRYLALPGLVCYSALLLSEYGRRFPLVASATKSVVRTTLQPQVFDSLVHIQNRGDVWFSSEQWQGARGGGLWIEGFALYPHDRYVADNLECRVMLAGGVKSGWHNCAEFFGTRGKSTPLIGISFRLGGPEAHMYKCWYRATCVDGYVTGSVEAGTWCRGGDQAAVEAFCISITPQPDPTSAPIER